MTATAKIDFSLIPVIDVARELLGQESRERSHGSEKHFPGYAGLYVNVAKNKWFSHGNREGGDALNLVCFLKSCDVAAGIAWLRTSGHAQQQSSAAGRVVATYDYQDESGAALYHVDRLEPKTFRQWREINGERVNGIVADTYERSRFGGAWYRVKDKPRLGAEIRKFDGVTFVPYRLRELLQSNGPVLIPAGEKDADSLRALSFTATTNHAGEGKWWDEITRYFKDRRVFLLLDNDQQGEKHCQIVGAALNGVASEIKVVRFPELAKGGDVSDFIEMRRGEGKKDDEIKQELARRFRDAPAWEPPRPEATANDDWPEPVSLPEGLSPVAPFDSRFLPSKIAPWVSDISDRMQCPPDYLGIAATVALGAVLGRKIGVAPEQKTDWYEVPNQWGLIVGRPGVMKTPSVEEALKPLHRLEVKAREDFDAARSEFETKHQEWKLRKDAAESKFKQDLKKNSRAVIDDVGPEPVEPPERRYVTNDTTYEKLGEILAQNPNGVAAYRDEVVSLLKTLDREEQCAARGFFLTAWGGKSRYTFDRIGRGRVHIEGACLSLMGSTQPGRLAEYVRRAVAGTAGDDGLIQRFGLLAWPDQPPEWKPIDRYPNSEARDEAWGVFVSFDSLDPGAVGATPTSQLQPVPVLRLDEEAHSLFLEWRSDLERKLRSSDEPLHPALESHLAKYRKLVPGLALINHLADGEEGMVGKQALARALGFAGYLETHARRAYGAGPEAETAAAKAVLSHIRKGDLKNGFSAREIQRRGWSHLTDRDQVQAGLNLLCDLDWLAAEDKRDAAGGRPTIHYHINPKAVR